MTATRKTIRSIALPAEHGGWGFWMEPVLLGWLVAFSLPGFLIGIGSLGLFLARQPLKLWLIDRRNGRQYVRTRLAERFLLLYGGSVIICFLAALFVASIDVLIPLILTSPLALIQLGYDRQGNTRKLLAELSGVVFMAMFATSIALAGGWQAIPALALGVILIARSIPSILYVRTRLKLEKGQATSAFPANVSHIIAVLVLILLTIAGIVPISSVIAGMILLLRAMQGLSRYRHPTAAKWIGVQEILFGLMTVILAAIGYTAM